jgi:hypothetical protein
MTHEQLQIFLDSHGADPAHWPAAQRPDAERLIATDAQARAVFDVAQRLDAALARVTQSVSAEEASVARVMTRLAAPLPRQKIPFWRWPAVLLDWQFAPAWPRVAALACCAAIGFVVGIAGLDRRFDRLDAPFTVANQDLGAVVFEPEPLTGAQP